MRIQICVKCKKRPASVFITRHENGNSVNEGLCFQCAAELGIKPPPVAELFKKMGIDDEVIQNMSDEISGLVEQGLVEVEGDDAEGGKAPTLNLGEIFGMPMNPSGEKGDSKGKKRQNQKEDDPAKKLLNTYCTNLNEKARAGKIDRIVGRDREIDRMIQILCRRQKNNPCLIGEPGVGKTAIVEELASRIVAGKVPEAIASFEVWLLDLTALVAGTQFRGQFESRILGLLKEIKAAGNIILMIDEVHNIAGAGETSDGSMSAANLLKPALSRGEIRVIGATTLKEYRKCIEKDSALERRFQPVKIEEPSVEDTVEIIKGIKGYYESFHGVSVSDNVARFAATLSERYITDRFLPDKAIDLIDEACAKAALSCPELDEKKRIDKRMKEIDALTAELEAKVEDPEQQTESNYQELANLKSEKIRLETRQKIILPIVNDLHLTTDDLLKVIEIWTGIPAAELSVGELGELQGLYERISAKVIGQDEAVNALVRAIRRKRAGVSYRQNPVSMIFAGPTGVGKTELVKVLSQDLFKQPESLIRLDMSEFMEKHSVSRIVGAPPGYVGYDEAGQLTEKIRRRPYSVVLFDEIEKAHPDVLNILLQVLDDGKITDAQGRQVNFENTVIIMTTNAGSESSSSISGFAEKRELKSKEKTEKALSTFLRPEFINRIDEIITFRHLDKDDFKKIAEIMLGKLRDHLADKGTKLYWNDDVLTHIANESYSEKYGARNMRRYIERQVEDKIASAVLDNYSTKITGISLSVSEGDIVLETI
ncbi:MAG: ATP-dependent Clp protease ATP-binding subunit [Ruminococcaceae bacterium]|nr:ATP-dependent Clp protease ATP-binding subunit [Oscillospiraceae bacterium]